jgi:hypothetical protein
MGISLKQVMQTTARATLNALLASGLTCAIAFAGDLSKYGAFQLGSDLATVEKQTGVSLSQVKVIHRRPVLIQELEWRSEGTGASASMRSTKDLVFSFYDGALFRIVIKYDGRETEGLTADDMVEAISRTYGVASHTTASAKTTRGRYSDEEQVLAQWEDANHHFDLIRSSYGGRYSLAAVLKRLEEPAAKALAEAARLDNSEAPQRELDRIAAQAESDRANLEKARVANKPKFRP